MANHVNSYISFENLSEKAEKFLEELMPDYQTSSDEVINKIFGLFMFTLLQLLEHLQQNIFA